MIQSAMKTRQIISIKEFRKIAGKTSDQFSDEQISELIMQLDYLAEIFVNKTLRKQEENDSETEEEATVPKYA